MTGTPSTAAAAGERAFRKLSKSGLLYQALRCFKYLRPQNAITFLPLLENLQKCSELLERNCRPGKPLWNILEEIAQTHGPPDRIKNTAKTILSITKRQSNDGGGSFCRSCGKADHQLEEGERMQFCGRCKSARYCCRECQVSLVKRKGASFRHTNEY